MENKLENNSAEGEEAGTERRRRRRNKNNSNHNNKKNNKKKSVKLKAKQWRNVGLMTGSGFRFFPPRCFIVF